MVRLVWLLFLVALASTAQAKRIKIYPAEPMLGQAVTLSMPADIPFIEKRFNWAALKHCFAVYGADYGSERVRFTLYPRRVGACDIKREKWETWEVPSRFVVRPNPDVKVQWTPPGNTAWVRQGVRWQAQVSLKSQSGYKAWLEAAQQDKRRWIFSPLINDQLQALWWPTRAGTETLESLFVAVKNPGGQIWRFPSDAISLKVQPLPVWLPADVLVGRIDAFVFKPSMMIAKGKAEPVQLVVGGLNLYPDLPPQPETLLPTVKDIRGGYGQTHVKTDWTPVGQVVQVTLQQPLIAEAYGPVRLPEMALQSFDPISGRVVRVSVPAQTLWVLPAWLITAGKFVAVILILGLVGVLARATWQLGWDAWLAWQARQQQGAALWHAMLRWYRWRIDPFKRHHLPRTLREWLASHPKPEVWQPIIQQLETTFFAKNPP
ncbi:hypothetical protein SAMN05443662_1673 [Sulfurivirga caldicuralii]|uniref:Oxygen tolerance n=1 Tax=Sulfurivirga caldicuralii TaxID=364032 RepID=A0A1N6HE31_9GAMM|nr:hypothetical protein [Sulfurivirga caldicuralii]SIO18042.1 hypothetical protein SAMN05443662_1673 [Sulfurivirga caldicuralii]